MPPLPPLDPDAGKQMVAAHDQATVDLIRLTAQLVATDEHIARHQRKRTEIIKSMDAAFANLIASHEGNADPRGLAITRMQNGSIVYWLPESLV